MRGKLILLQRETLKREQRIKSKKEISLFFQEKRMVSSKCMQMWIASGERAALRLCVAAGQAFDSAVQRNKAKRILREIYRKLRCHLDEKYDVLLIARRPILTTDFESIKKEFLSNAEKLGILKKR